MPTAPNYRFGLPHVSVTENAKPQNIQEFVTLLKRPSAEIRTWIDWHMLYHSGANIREYYLSDREAIGALQTVWYRTPDGNPADWDDQTATRLTLKDTLTQPDAVYPADTISRNKFLSLLANESSPIQLTIPACGLSKTATLILDGNHRAAALYASKRHLLLRLLVVEYVTDPQIIPDALHNNEVPLSTAKWQETCQALRQKFLSL